MMKVKRMLAFVLALAMTLSLVVFPASAEEAFTVSLSDATATVTQTEGQEVTVDVNVSGLKEGEGWSALTLYVYYDSEILEFVEGTYGEAGETAAFRLLKSKASLSDQISAEKDAQDANENNDKEELCVGIAATAAAKTGDPVLVTETGAIWTLTFKAKAGLESQQLPLTLVCTKAEVSGDSTIVPETKGATVTINGVAPELDYVEVTDATGNVLAYSKSETGKYTVEKRADEVTLDSKTSYTYYVKAYSKKGTDITDQVQWSISHDRPETVGAQLDETDKENKIVKVTIPEKGGSPRGVTLSVITAKMPEAAAGKTAKILYRRADSIPTSADISLREGSSASLQVPGTDAADVTAQFDAVVYDQFGEDITRTALGSSCYWYVESANAGSTSTSGISMNYNTGLLTVKSNALNTVQNGNTNYTVFIRANGGKRVGTYPITVSLSDRVPSSVVISGGPANSTLPVLKTGDPTATATATYTATVYDQYGTEIENPGEIRWYLEAGDESQQFGTGNERKFIAMKEFAQTFAEGSTSRKIFIKAICGDASGTTPLTLTREPARATRIAMEDITIAVPKSGEANVTRSYLEVYDQYDIKMGSPTFEKTTTPNTLNGVTFTDDKITVTSAAAGNTFTDGKLEISVTITCNSASTDIVSATKTITLTRDSAEAKKMIWGTDDRPVEVPAKDSGKADANVTVTVYDQYGQKMTDAKVELAGEQEGFVWEGGKLYVTKAAKTHFGGERQDEVTVYVRLKSGAASATVPVKLKLEAAQTNPSSATISGQTSIARPTDDTPNTAEYSISDVIKDQYGLRMQNVDRSKLSLKLYSDQACVTEVTGAPVTLSGPDQSGQWTVTVTKDAELNKTYYLMAKYNDQQCSDATPITITNKQEGARLTVVQGDITYGETVNPSVSNKPAGAGAITYTYVGRDGTTYNSSDAPTNAGKYTVTATCEDATHIYTGSVDFQILPKEIKVDWIELTNDEYTYNGQQQTVKYTVKDKDINKLLKEGTDYTVKDNSDSGTNAGPYLLEITGKGNYYSDPDATVPTSVTWNIWALPVKINTATFKPRGYAKDDYSAALDTLTLVADKDGVVMPDNLTEGNGFTVSDIRVTNNNAGQQPVSFKVTLTNTNYKWAVPETGNIFNVSERAGFKVTISKIDHRAETAAAAGKYGNQLSVDLSQVLPEGWSATASSIDNTNAVLTEIHGGAMYIMEQDGKLWLQLTNDSNKVGKDATVTLTVNSTNYNPFTITVTVTVQNKKTQTVTANDLNVTYGDAGVKLNASALDNAKLTYQVTEGADVVAVDANGNVTLRKSGTAKIQITAAETEDYGTANTTVTVTVAKRSLTVKANDLTAYVGGQLPALDYTVTGLVSGDTLTTVPELELKDVPAGVDPMKTAGTYTIGFKTAPVADKDKYDLTVETGTLTVSSRPNVNPVPAGNSVKLEEAAGGKLTSSVSRATKGTTVTITVKPDAGYQLEELEVLDKNGEALPLKELANGKFSFQMPDSKVTVQASFVQESTYAGYPDVLPQDWFYSSVRYVTERGLMNGTPNGFEPNMDSSRATIWTILARFSGVDTTVVSGEWYAVARQWAMENGVSDGTNPNGVITREQLATMLYRFAKNKGLVQEPVTADLSVFVDAGQISDYALDAMRWAVSVGLLNGMDGSRLAPQGSAARAQVAAMLMRFDQLAK